MVQDKLNRQAQVDGKNIFVFDDTIDQKIVNEIYQALLHAPFTRSEMARPDTNDYRHWAYNMPLDKALQTPLYQIAKELVQKSFNKKFNMYRCYCNLVSYGDIQFIHTDCQPGAGEITVLWYIQDEWEVEWAGETLFFDKNDDALFVATPKPGRVVLFDAEIKHKGSPPSKICTKPRLTFAMKFEAEA